MYSILSSFDVNVAGPGNILIHFVSLGNEIFGADKLTVYDYEIDE